MSLAATVLVAVLLSFGCGAGPTAEEVERSMREFQLAEELRKEGNTPAAIEHLRKSLDLDPRNARAHLLLGYIQMQRRNYEPAAEHLRKSLDLLQKDAGEVGGALAEARNILGVALIHAGKPDEAVPVLEASAKDALNRAPHLAWGNLGLAHYEKGEYEAALHALERAVDIQPRFCVGHFRMGRVHFARKEFDEAEQALSKALEADEVCDGFQRAWRLRGETRARLEQRDEAIADFERCVELGPDSEAGRACKRFLEGTE